MSAIEKFTAYTDEQRRSIRWLSMLGKEYNGGGGGIGRVCRVALKAEIYFQDYDGSQNYHEMPSALVDAMQMAIIKNFGVLAMEAQTIIDETARELALKSVSEYASLLASAGLEPQRAQDGSGNE